MSSLLAYLQAVTKNTYLCKERLRVGKISIQVIPNSMITIYDIEDINNYFSIEDL